MAEALNRLSDDWNDLRQIIVYGFGRVAQRNIHKLLKDFEVKCIVDNNQEFYKKSSYMGIPIVKFEKIKLWGEKLHDAKVIVTTSAFAYASIKKDLESIGLKEYVDYCRLEDFLPEWYWKK